MTSNLKYYVFPSLCVRLQRITYNVLRTSSNDVCNIKRITYNVKRITFALNNETNYVKRIFQCTGTGK